MNVLLAAAAEIIKFETALLVLAIGGLLVLAKIVSDLRSEVRHLRGGPAVNNQPPVKTLPAPVASSDGSQEIPDAVFTAIAAAVYCTMGDQHRIVSVSSADSLMWSREGRRSIFRSHSFG